MTDIDQASVNIIDSVTRDQEWEDGDVADLCGEFLMNHDASDAFDLGIGNLKASRRHSDAAVRDLTISVLAERGLLGDYAAFLEMRASENTPSSSDDDIAP